MINIEQMNVLLVDDMPSMTKFMYKMMKNLGFGREFFVANSGREAMRILAEEHVDLVLLDYNMPDISGNEVLSRIREDNKLRDILVIMVTAEGYSDFVAEMGESEVDAYILKPLNIQVLEEKVRMLVEKVNNPSPVDFHLKRARDLVDSGDYASAIDEARLAMEANPNLTKPIRELGYIYYLNNDLEEAKIWFEKAAALNKLDVFACHYLGQIYLKQDDIEKALIYLDRAMKISPRHLERGIDFAKILVRMGKQKKAIEVFNWTLELSGSTVKLKEEVIDFCIENDLIEYSIKLLEGLIFEKPKRADLLLKLGIQLEKINQTIRAINHLTRASQMDKDNMEIRLHLAKDYLAMNKPVLAEGHLTEILKVQPNNETARKLLRQCIDS
jgi:DNA-binding response OmpR family regulator